MTNYADVAHRAARKLALPYRRVMAQMLAPLLAGDVVSPEAMLAAIGTNSANPDALLKVRASHLRSALKGAGIEPPLATVYDRAGEIVDITDGRCGGSNRSTGYRLPAAACAAIIAAAGGADIPEAFDVGPFRVDPAMKLTRTEEAIVLTLLHEGAQTNTQMVANVATRRGRGIDRDSLKTYISRIRLKGAKFRINILTRRERGAVEATYFIDDETRERLRTTTQGIVP